MEKRNENFFVCSVLNVHKIGRFVMFHCLEALTFSATYFLATFLSLVTVFHWTKIVQCC